MGSGSVLYQWRAAARAGRPLSEAAGRARNPSGKTRVAYSDAERVAAVTAYKHSGLTQRAFAKTWGLSIKTLSGWLVREQREGSKGLATRKRGRPKGSLNRTGVSPAVSAAIVATKARFPDFGLKRVAQYLLRFGGVKVAPATVRRTLARAGVKPAPPIRRPRRARPLPRRFERARANQLWQTDITSFVLPRPGARVYLTVFLDDHSRYVVSWALATHQKGDLVIEALRDGIARFGKPQEVLTDQGRQYFAWRGKSRFQKELKRLGVAHVVARSHHPQTVGKCERLWETVQRELLSRCSPNDLGEARERLGHFFAHYNHLRPHQGLDGLVPADRFFGAETTVRAQLEANLSANELALAIGEPLRQPVYLVGQVGEQPISMHGERGRLVVVTPSGRQELSLQDLGAASSAPQLEETTDGTIHDDDHPEADASERQAAALCGAEAGAAGAGAVGGGERGGEGEGAHDLRGDPGVVDGSQDQGGGGERAGTDGPAGVAIESVGLEWDAGGAAEATEAAREGGDEGSLGRQESGSGGAAQGERRAQAPAGRGGASDRAAAGDPDRQGPLAAAGAGGGDGGWESSSGREEDGATSGCESP
jgi:transposase InsO family protein